MKTEHTIHIKLGEITGLVIKACLGNGDEFELARVNLQVPIPPVTTSGDPVIRIWLQTSEGEKKLADLLPGRAKGQIVVLPNELAKAIYTDALDIKHRAASAGRRSKKWEPETEVDGLVQEP